MTNGNERRHFVLINLQQLDRIPAGVFQVVTRDNSSSFKVQQPSASGEDAIFPYSFWRYPFVVGGKEITKFQQQVESVSQTRPKTRAGFKGDGVHAAAFVRSCDDDIIKYVSDFCATPMFDFPKTIAVRDIVSCPPATAPVSVAESWSGDNRFVIAECDAAVDATMPTTVNHA